VRGSSHTTPRQATMIIATVKELTVVAVTPPRAALTLK
jgi:hypothetical protein